MKRTLVVASIGALALGGLLSFSASAQTCAAPNMWQPPAAGQTFTGLSTCGGQVNTDGLYCGGNFGAPGPAYVFQSTFSASGSYTNITISNVTGFGGAVYVVPTSSVCGTGAACTATGAPGAPIPSSAIPAGTYYIYVTAADFDANGACGTFDFASDGSFPVTLQNFTVS